MKNKKALLVDNKEKNLSRKIGKLITASTNSNLSSAQFKQQ
jgi:hypothetical protein